MLVATAGHDTISFCLTGGMQALLDHPDQFASLRSDPGLLDTAIEEMLRWTSPGRHIMRTATEDTVLGSQPIRAGEAVALFMNSANRDETVFEDADTFRIDRRPNPHIAFGFGRHTCVGAHLARLEMRALFKALLPRLKAAELAAPISRTQSTMVTGIASLPVAFTWQ
jgi:cytochrome P450